MKEKVLSKKKNGMLMLFVIITDLDANESSAINVGKYALIIDVSLSEIISELFIFSSFLQFDVFSLSAE